MSSRIKMLGRTFNQLTVLEETSLRDSSGIILYKCLCICGEIKNVSGGNLRANNTKSCGCFRKNRMTKHGLQGSTEYWSWQHMKQRCLNPKNKRFKDYGGRGIKVCSRWLNSFENFLEDMGPKPGPKYSIDRIENDGNYSPSNCKWSTVLEQNNNKRPVNLGHKLL